MKPADPNAPRAPRGPADPTYMRYAGAGLQFALTFLLCGALGFWLDGKFGTEPWLMIGGILAGAAGAMYSLVLRVGGSRTARSMPESHKPHRPTPAQPTPPAPPHPPDSP